jgi:hypothetical protein
MMWRGNKAYDDVKINGEFNLNAIDYRFSGSKVKFSQNFYHHHRHPRRIHGFRLLNSGFFINFNRKRERFSKNERENEEEKYSSLIRYGDFDEYDFFFLLPPAAFPMEIFI